MLLHQVALSSFHNGRVRAHEGHRILLDLITEEQCTPICKTHMHLTENTAYQFVFVFNSTACHFKLSDVMIFKKNVFFIFYEKVLKNLKLDM